MGRLTGQNQYRIPFISGVDTSDLIRHLGNRDSVLLRDAIDRLAAYEDAMHLERVQELAQAERAGRLVVLPDGEDTATLAATIDRTDMFRVWCGGTGDLLLGMLSVLADEVAKRCGTSYGTLLMFMAAHRPIVDMSRENRTEEGRQ